MNAKKIMGAVLVALLAAALFVGAGAAATVFVYQTGVTDTNLQGDWISDKGQVSIIGGNVTPVGTFTPGIYENATGAKLSIVYPTATIYGVAGNAQAAYPFIGADLFEGDDSISITNVSASSVKPVKYLLTYPNTTTVEVTGDINTTVAALTKGTYKLAVLFDYANFISGTDVNLLKTEPVTFTIVGEDDATIAASADQMNKGEIFTITVTGQPGVTYKVNTTQYAFNVTANQPGIDLSTFTTTDGNITIVMPNSGKVAFTIAGNTSVSAKEQTIKLLNNAGKTLEKITVKFAKGTLTAKTEAASYFVGDTITVVGTTTAGEPSVAYVINGTNFHYVHTGAWTDVSNDYECEGDSVKTFSFDINTSNVYDDSKRMDVGTYTLILTAGEVKAYVPITLKQPFISIIEAPEVIAQGEDDVEFIINAEATKQIAYYIFGTNYFAYDVETDNVEDEDGEDILNQFVIGLESSETEAMAPGQYFAVFQHPMYDGVLNIFADDGTSSWPVYLNSNTNVLFNVKDRQTANAAQALCDALDTQNIDDMYVKYSFFVVGKDQSFTISDIPTTVAQGETITISGVDTANAEGTVVVEMLSTAFAAVPKETVGSAAFIVVSTKIADDGTWEVTLDTSDLNVDEYSLSVAIDNVPKKTVTVNVVEGAETPDTPDTPDVPDTPDTPDTPTEPTTPGFGALAALAGLGAVAVLLLRRE